MTWFGWQGGWPLQFGGGPTPIEKINQALFDAVGKGHAADQDGVEWLWRNSRAVGLAMMSTLSERAVAQFDPRRATDALPYYRELFALPVDLSDQLAREAADIQYHTKPQADVPSIAATLANIDPRFSIVERPWGKTGTTVPGRTLEDWEGTAPFGIGRGETLYPNYSNAFELVVLFDITTPVESVGERAALGQARRYLDSVLPSFDTYSIRGSIGFIVGSSPLGWTGFGE
jgi:hypothetical protein